MTINPSWLRTTPAHNYAEAMACLAVLQAQDGSDVNPVCRSFALTHGQRTPRALVFFHGYTNCPAQFRGLAELFFARGYSVLVPRLPFHGLFDRMAADHARLTADSLVASTQTAVDIACGLGEEVAVAGLSGGGVMAAWAAQVRADVALAVIAAPSFGLPFVSPAVSTVGQEALRVLPNFFVWWDPRTKAAIPGPTHAYPRWATHALAEIMRLGAVVRRQARRAPPAARAVVVLTNAADLGVNNRMAYRLSADWQRQVAAAGRAGSVRTYEFSRAQAVLHDMIDPAQLEQKTALVYPVWLELIDGALGRSS
jgi:alpha-beta hydrolase superfamily lysophospholipase